MIDGMIEGVSTYTRAIKMLSEHKLWKYVILPGVVSVILTMAIIGFTLAFAGNLGDLIVSWYPWETGKAIFERIASILSAILLIALIVFLFKYLVMVIVAPFMGTLSEKVESILTGTPPPSVTPAQFVQDILRGLRIALRNIIREIIYTLFLLLLNVVPVIGSIVSTVMIFLIQAYYAGFGNMDYTLERKRYTVKESVLFVREHRGLAIGNGAIFLLIFLVPVIGWFLAPAYGTIAATMNSLKRIR